MNVLEFTGFVVKFTFFSIPEIWLKLTLLTQ